MASKKNHIKIDSKTNSNKVVKSSVSRLHVRNLHQGRYDMSLLCHCLPALKPFITKNVVGDETISFNDPKAILTLNQALLAYYYNVDLWQIPEGYLCPPIPGRADYIHYLADLLAQTNDGEIPRGKPVRVLDVGCGASCIYPIIGSQSYGWQFVGSDIDLVSVNCAKNIVQSNRSLTKHIKLIQQKTVHSIFKGIIKPDDYFELTMCNPPFYESIKQAQDNNQRKKSNLLKNQVKRCVGSASDQTHQGKGKDKERNFGGQNTELWCQGGELKFVTLMAEESVLYKGQVHWFSSLISNVQNVPKIKTKLKQVGASEILVVNMAQGNKISRFIAWNFGSTQVNS
jgi:23S rRNA (adenine1618-N6)-methyltransferase